MWHICETPLGCLQSIWDVRMTNYVYCTASCSMDFVDYFVPQRNGEHTGEPNRVIRKVTINGGAGVAKGHGRLVSTEPSAMTQISDEDLEFLEKQSVFQQMKTDGFIEVRKSKIDLQKVVDKGMNPRDKSSPRIPSDYKKSDANDPDMYNPKKGARLGQVGKVN